MISYIISYINKKLKPPPLNLPVKDPYDFSLTESSTRWITEQFCEFCKHKTCFEEHMSDVCNSCGGHGRMTQYRSRRTIWNGEDWITQIKYSHEMVVIDNHNNIKVLEYV